MKQITVYHCTVCEFTTKKEYDKCPKCNETTTEEYYTTKSGKKLSGKALLQFEAFWKEFDYKKGKANAADIWSRLYRGIDFVTYNRILKSASREANNRDELIMQGRIPIMAQGWLHSRRWEDEIKDKRQVSKPKT